MSLRALIAALLTCLLPSACTRPEPVQIGFIGGLTGINSDNGQAGLNGVTLAIEQCNSEGGVQGRKVELLWRDHGQDPAAAAQGARELGMVPVEALIGPYTSAMAAATLPVTKAAGVFQISPTITSMDFHGKDDNLFRINRTTRDNGRDYAAMLARRGQHHVAVAYDTRNRSFSESWLKEFRAQVQAGGHRLAAEVPFASSDKAQYEAVVRRMLAHRPDGLLFIAGAVDTANLALQARRQAPTLRLSAAEWAATEQLIELGGRVVEGLLIAQNFDRDEASDRFRHFSDAYFKRFQRKADYSAVSSYDAATVVLGALRRRQKGQSMKEAVLAAGPFQGLQQTIVFDPNGDTERKVYFTEVRNGRYTKID